MLGSGLRTNMSSGKLRGNKRERVPIRGGGGEKGVTGGKNLKKTKLCLPWFRARGARGWGEKN